MRPPRRDSRRPGRSLHAAGLGLLLSTLSPLAAGGSRQDGAAAASPFGLPPGPAAEAVARVTPETVPAAIPGEPWPDWSVRDEHGWGAPEPWQRWAALVRAEAGADAPDPEVRAQLALCARAQGRDRDAWEHLAACAARPDLVAALLPRFLPGVTTRAGLGGPATSGGATGAVLPGGLPGDLRSGDVLRPPLPPALDPVEARALGIWAPTLTHAGFAVGDARVSFALELSEEGVEVLLTHLSGPPVELTVVLPEPRSQTIRSVYANWEQQDDPRAPITLRLSAEEPEGELWGRFFERFVGGGGWPEALPPGVDPRVEAGLVRIVGDPDDPFLGGVRGGLSALLGTEVALVSPGTPPETFREPLALGLTDGPHAEVKLLALLGSAERYGLRGDVPVSEAVPPEDGR